MPNTTLKLSAILFFTLAGIFIIDQNIKMLFVDGFRYYTDCIDLILVYNKGVAFSMLAFLDEWLKYIQLVLVIGILGYIINLKKICFAFPAGLMLGGAFSNVYDRFVHGGVVDMVYWHCGFDFAVFNFADVMIDVAVVWFLVLNFKPKLCKK
ncbi:lipoprotein signal peptidase [Sulfurimonas gotlandica GD1]|jgi:signal peptidase II|uniref:Lipoprotein signal peptidase n=1 Tax=Sulfurimonas gotlandica (strain DSM 19862 / JCM 16533 / GD1) TaxID=929558 RepID=B6BGU0_SULGG|nr:signal peptidase II [Sulfurimonas gotlandica]EDZ62931.1 signal peptidase II [Sulfurimonas gotlandica GD1]EHP29722.1 lipoprotein signal peptidase [Sulfurimonas gotlandica GD1]